MTYDWERSLEAPAFSPQWYGEIDRRFFRSAYYAQRSQEPPFSRFLRGEDVRGKRVLEIGCGMGTHAELLTRLGARLTAIDQTEVAVRATTNRLNLHGLPADVRQMDAEDLDLPAAEFDVVWSWGVIHHSRSTEKIIQSVSKVLKPGGSLRIMVYYRPSLVYWVHCGLIRGVLMGQIAHKSLKQIYVDSTDGYYARTFTKRELNRLLMHQFEPPRFTIVGLKPELFPIPRSALKTWLEAHTPDSLASTVLGQYGSMIYAESVRK